MANLEKVDLKLCVELFDTATVMDYFPFKHFSLLTFLDVYIKYFLVSQL